MLRPAAAPVAPEDELLAALTPVAARRDPNRIAALAAAADPGVLVALLERHGLLALLGQRLGGAAPPPVAQAAERDRVANAARAVMLEATLDEVRSVLAGDGIAAVGLKGPRLARRAHGDPALRRSADVDVLVAPEDLRAAAVLLQRQGYAAPTDPLDGSGRPALHLMLAHPAPNGPAVELHWRVHWAEERHGAAMLARRLSPADELAVLLLCYARDGFVGLRLAADIAGWWDAHGAALPDRALDAIADDHPLLAPVLATAAIVAERVAGVPAERLLGLGAARERAARLANPLARGDAEQLRGGQLAVDLLLGGRAGARSFAWRQLQTARRLPRLRDRLLHAPRTAGRMAAALIGRPPVGGSRGA